jgi:hypothetical protein
MTGHGLGSRQFPERGEKSNRSSNQRRLEIYLKIPRQTIFADTIRDSF